jgi:hypothetical protein
MRQRPTGQGKGTPHGNCKLCLQDKELCDSHLLPKSMYALLKSTKKDPVMVTSEVARHTSRQVKHYLLCSACEDILNRGGETWLLPLLATIEGTFPLFDIIASVPPEVDEPDIKAYAASKNPTVDIEKLVHFGAGIFWKGSVHSWKRGESEPLINLGPYAEQLRLFLLGKNKFPEHMTMHVTVLPPPVKMISAHLPTRGVSSGFRSYCLYVPGIDFRLCVGKTIPIELRRTCLYHGASHPIVMAAEAEHELMNEIRGVLSAARKSAKLSKWLKGPREAS